MDLKRSILDELIFVLIFVYGVYGTCDHATVTTIAKKWDSNFPDHVLEKSVGDLTYVYMSPTVVTKDDPKVYCLATRLRPDQTTASDIYVYRDMVNHFETFPYKKIENSGKITLKADRPGSSDESQYIVSFKNHVLVFWQCVDKDTSGQVDSVVGIAVDVNHVNDADVQAEILEAKKTLKSLGLGSGEDLNPCTPEMLKSVKKSDEIDIRR